MRESATRLPNIRKIAVLRANAIGDFIVALPALEALRKAYPGAEIVLLAAEWHRTFLAERPGPVDRVVVVPPYGGVGEKPGHEDDRTRVEAFFEEMGAESFDLAVQIHGGGRYSNPFVHRLGAAMTVGLKSSDAPAPDRWVPYEYFQHEILRYLEVVALVGAEPVGLEPFITVIERDREEAQAVVPESDRPLIAIHPGATDPRRRWPARKFAAVGDALARAGACVVVTGGDDEREDVREVVEAMRMDADDLCGRLSLSGLAGLLARCRVVVSNDSGPRHLAAAVGSQTVGIYWCYNVINFASLTRTHHRPCISWRLDCPVCGIDCTQSECGHTQSFVADIPHQEVIASALELFAWPTSSGLGVTR